MRKGSKVALAPVREEDLPLLFEWINDRESRLFSAPYGPVDEPTHKTWFESLRTRSDQHIFGIRSTAGDELVGLAQLRDVHATRRSAQLRVRIGEAARRGKGLGSEAVGLLLDFAFQDLNLNRVWLYVLGDNDRAVRVYEKAGFVREGVLRKAEFIDGKYVDLAIMGILREEYEGPQAGS